MSERTTDEVRSVVREAYGRIAREGGSCGCGPRGCGPTSLALGYREEDLAAAPEGADMGLGCGNPQAIAALREGESVLDLGCGGGFDAFLAARQVGPGGRVIGVDMTADMIAKARANATRVGARHVEFRLGEIERLPVADASVDVILSNCVINLSPDKAAVFAEAFRVLREGGRLAIADVVATAELPESLRADAAALTGCLAGAAHVDAVRELVTAAGFTDVRVQVREEMGSAIAEWLPGAERYVASATIEAIKPRSATCCAPECCA